MGVFYVKPTFLPIWDTRHPPKSSPASSHAVRTVSVHDFWTHLKWGGGRRRMDPVEVAGVKHLN